MEHDSIEFSAKPGFALPAVLFIALLGVLIGIGRLLMFNYQCRLRIDCQHEYEKVFAVRSALNYLQNWNGSPSLPEEGAKDARIVFRTSSGRDVKVVIHPADAIFPIVDNANHYYIMREMPKKDGTGNLLLSNASGRFRYASSVNGDADPNAVPKYTYTRDPITRDPIPDGILMMPTNAVQGDVCRLSLDMCETGRWSDDPFGRRYQFNIMQLANAQGTNDTVRLILRRKRASEEGTFNQTVAGIPDADRAWRPIMNNEAVIYAEIANGCLRAVTQRMVKDVLEPEQECIRTNAVNQNIIGIQLAGRCLTLFQASSGSGGTFKEYNLLGTSQIPIGVYHDFTNNYNSTEAQLLPELVMELEVEAGPGRDGTGNIEGESEESKMNRFNKFEVFPAFEFEISVVNRNEVGSPKPKLATVVHLDMDNARSSAKCTAISYDTHGTEHKGFRYDERHPDGK